jgi:acyl carrier protein
MDTEQIVKQIVTEQLGVDANEVTLAANLVNDLGADSLDTVELILTLEEEFEIAIPDEEAQNIQTVGQIVDFLKSHAK